MIPFKFITNSKFYFNLLLNLEFFFHFFVSTNGRTRVEPCLVNLELLTLNTLSLIIMLLMLVGLNLTLPLFVIRVNLIGLQVCFQKISTFLT